MRKVAKVPTAEDGPVESLHIPTKAKNKADARKFLEFAAKPENVAKLAKGMGHNYYGEPAWPNDLLYIFPVVILGTIACVVGLAVPVTPGCGCGA